MLWRMRCVGGGVGDKESSIADMTVIGIMSKAFLVLKICNQLRC